MTAGGNGGNGNWHYMSNRISSGGHPSDTWKDGVFPSGKCMGGEGGKSGGGGAMRVSYI